jgi:predicted DNA-binding transcriptional regulator YafY
MTRLDRALGILLLLSHGGSVTAPALARRFEVSVRTIYRDIDMLSALGVPVYADRGTTGGYRLLEGYFLPPVAFSRSEAIALLVGLTHARSLHVTPLAGDLDTAERKLIGILPPKLRTLLGEAKRLIGFERTAHDAFHQAPPDGGGAGGGTGHGGGHWDGEVLAVDAFLKAVLDGTRVELEYRSPYRSEASRFDAEPLGLFWDRDRWYLVGRSTGRPGTRLWRADRVVAIAASTIKVRPDPEFDVGAYLDRKWLTSAMQDWARSSPVRIRLERSQVERLRADWYYRHAGFDWITPDRAIMSFGEDDPRLVFDLVRWLGPGAELLEPPEWRALLRQELDAMREPYGADTKKPTDRE